MAVNKASQREAQKARCIMEYIESEGKWRLDRHIPIMVLLAILAQTMVWIWWLAAFTAKIEMRVEALEHQSQMITDMPVRMASMEEQMISTAATLKDIRDDIRQEQRDNQDRRRKL